MNSNGGEGGEITFIILFVPVPFTSARKTPNLDTETQRQTVFGMSSDRHLELKAFLLETIQKEEEKGLPSTLPRTELTYVHSIAHLARPRAGKRRRRGKAKKHINSICSPTQKKKKRRGKF